MLKKEDPNTGLSEFLIRKLAKSNASLCKTYKYNFTANSRSRYENSICPCRTLKSIHNKRLL